MEYIDVCPLCKQPDAHKLHLEARDFLVSGETFAVTRCTACNLLITNPKPSHSDTPKYYKSTDYVSHTDARRNLKEVLYAWVKNLMIKKKLKWVEQNLEPRAFGHEKGAHRVMVDYGCGTGEFLARASKEGFRPIGIEPDPDARQKALQKGVDVEADLESLELSPESVDVITLWHVLEHIPDIPAVIRKLTKLLRPGGILIVAVPMANSYDAVHYKEAWAAWDLPRHLWHFTPESLHQMLKPAPIEYVATYPLPFDAWYISLLSEQHKRILAKGGQAAKMSPDLLLKAARIAAISNHRARNRKSAWSSQTFIYRKTEK